MKFSTNGSISVRNKETGEYESLPCVCTWQSTPVAMILGCGGQDGSYLAELLLNKGYIVYGVVRRVSTDNTQRLEYIKRDSNFHLAQGDVTDFSSMLNLITKYKPDYIYNLAAQSHVGSSFDQPLTTWDITAQGCLNILEVIKQVDRNIRFYQASSSEMFGNSQCPTTGYNEHSEFLPQSPYAIAKLAAHHAVRLYRESYGIFACSGILHNHESSRRGEQFVTRKITKYIGRVINKKTDEKLYLGNLNSYRDWGHAKDYVRAMYLMMTHDKPDDYVVATGETHAISSFLSMAFAKANLDVNKHVAFDEKLVRPAEVNYLKGDSTKIRDILGWKPTISFEELVQEMVDYDILQCSLLESSSYV